MLICKFLILIESMLIANAKIQIKSNNDKYCKRIGLKKVYISNILSKLIIRIALI